ncbi:uncharacterized protein EAF01_005078 [Botrytis porri]|uniref:GTP-binding protein 8 n=1 Tax=Botrytis porri TaxID=87229 RepID=A0A4Z1L6K0_9HELO|nr:uncharacterized protein EAF01_005078 [Botrytis porri]KAF7907492.1 hypothetical protein EAF01_005078 [Botrytis porri]TGO92462.1 hypothetical protein BPOR_0002g00090 [Botrytis porri]
MSTLLRIQSCARTNRRDVISASYILRGLKTISQGHDSQIPHHMNFPSTKLCYHWDTLPPTEAQLVHANGFFTKKPPKHLWSTSQFYAMEFGDSSEVCFLGRSNVGKSSLLNALLNTKAAYTSSKPGRTRSMNAFAIGGHEESEDNIERLVVLDMPGYGHGGRPEWGKEIIKYLEKRKQLKRAFVLIDAEHGIKESDRVMLQMLRSQKVPHQVVLSKIDKILFASNTKRIPSNDNLKNRMTRIDKVLQETKEMIEPDPESEDADSMTGEILTCTSEKCAGRKYGIDAVRFAMLRAAGLHIQPKIRLAKQVDIISHEELFEGLNTAD